ncbi:MAG: hypothetical protein ACYTFN_04515 [Planctomycetota bacterium]
MNSSDPLVSAIMAGMTNRELVHKVNNLIAVIYTQTAIGKGAETYEEAVKALEIIERAAQEMEKMTARAREQAREEARDEAQEQAGEQVGES